MQRQAIRATVGGKGVDVPIGVFSAREFAAFDGTQLLGKVHAPLCVAANDSSAGIAPTDIPGLTVAVAHAGSYAFEFYLHHTLSVQPSTIGFCINASANFTSIAAIGEIWPTATTFNYGTLTVNNVAFTVSKTITTTSIAYLRGLIVVSGACTLSCRAQRSANTLTVLAGSGGYFMEL